MVAQGAVVAAAPQPFSGVGTSATEKVDEAQIALANPMRAGEVYGLLTKASNNEPIEIKFRSGEWTGGIIVSGDTPQARELVRQFLETNPAAASEQPVFAIGASEQSVEEALQSIIGIRTKRIDAQSGSVVASPDAAAAGGSINPPGGCSSDTDCDEWVNNDGYEPTVPQNGQLRQARLQGVVESTDHTLRSFSKRGYSAVLHHVALTQGHGGTITPTYGYEHDYKVTNNGYVQSNPDYSWSTNLPGAYRDTRASDNSSVLDFTVGTLFTWLLDGSKTYEIRTVVTSPEDGEPTNSTARLTAQVLPNDGSFDAATAAAGGGCSFALDPANGNTVPSQDTHNYAWCTGIGGGAGSQKAAYSYISTTPFAIQYTGSCRNWILSNGATNC